MQGLGEADTRAKLIAPLCRPGPGSFLASDWKRSLRSSWIFRTLTNRGAW
jgi:hypothetical protein